MDANHAIIECPTAGLINSHLSDASMSESDEVHDDSKSILRADEETKPYLPSVSIPFPSCRMVLMLMSFLGFINVYCLRVNLSVALVDMVNSSCCEDTSHVNATSQNQSVEECTYDVINTTSLNNVTAPTNHGGKFAWDTNTRGVVLAAFFYGYIVTQIPGGWLAERFGGKRLLGGGILCTALFTLLTPLAAQWHVGALIAVRVLEGIGEGVTFPSMQAMLAKWAPPYERSKMVTFIYAGAQLGTVIGMPVSGLLCHSGLLGGWPSVFYFFGLLGCVWFIAWIFLCYDSPAQHPRISLAERQFIETAIGQHAAKKSATPWCSILTSMPVWAMAAAHFSNNWGYYTLLTCLPLYMKDVLKFDVEANGILSGIPYLAAWIVMTTGGQLADCLRRRKYLSTRNTRKLFNLTGLLLPAGFLVITGFVGCNKAVVVAMVIAAVGCSGLAMSGYGVNSLDLAPSHAGTLMGFSNTLATIPGFVGPQVVGVLTYHQATRGQWLKVFYISAAIYCFGALVYTVFGSGDEQPWSKSGQRRRRSYDETVVTNADVVDDTSPRQRLLSNE